MKKKRILAAIVGFVIIFAVLIFFLLKELRSPEKIEKLRIGIFPDTICTLIYIAQQQGMFKRQGLDISFENYQAGTYAVNDLLAGKVDAATATGFVLAMRAFKNGDLRAVGTISSSDNVEVVASKDRGIGKPEDMRGKVIGVTKGSIAEFFLSTSLTFNNIHSKEVRIIDLKPSEMVTALSEGKIDAASCFSPFTDEMKKNLAQNAISWPAQGGQEYYFLLITSEELIKTRPQAITGLLKGVLEAEEFSKRHEKEAVNIVAHALNVAPETVAATWSKTRFRVGLDQSLLTLMEDEARWAIKNKYVDSTKVPNYFNFLYLEGLKKIRPEAVSVIH